MHTAKYILLSLVIGLLLIGLGVVLTTYVWTDYDTVAISAAVLVSLVAGILAYVMVRSRLHADGKQFMGAIMVGMLIKMAIGLSSVLVVALSFRPVVKEYVTVFFIAYFIFTAFEVYALMRNLRAENQGPSKEG
ncbi:MAG: hypothetical protein AB8F95_03545 [Bacteroidia bacterium]